MEVELAEGNRDAERFLPLSNLSFHTLLALGGGPAHGYRIGKEIERRSGGSLNPTTGGLYLVLKRLSESGLVTQEPDGANKSRGPKRKCFRLTSLGRRVAALEARRLAGLVAEARKRDLFGES